MLSSSESKLLKHRPQSGLIARHVCAMSGRFLRTWVYYLAFIVGALCITVFHVSSSGKSTTLDQHPSTPLTAPRTNSEVTTSARPLRKRAVDDDDRQTAAVVATLLASANVKEIEERNDTAGRLTTLPPTTTTPANPHSFRWLIRQSDLCTRPPSQPNRRPFVLAVVHSSPAHFNQRMFIRNTWGNVRLYPRLRMFVLFAMGIEGGADASRSQLRIGREAEQFKDIIQEDFLDSYRNLTYKAQMWMRWISSYCSDSNMGPNAPKFILKVDDDMFVNSFNLIRHLSHMYRRKIATKDTISCLVWYKTKVIRDKKSKWYVSEAEFADKVYPTYCSGSAYLLSADVVPRMWNQSLTTRFMWVDDFYVTGELARRLQLQFHQSKTIYSISGNDFGVHRQKLRNEFAVFAHLPHSSLNQRYQLWKEILEDSHRATTERL